MTKVISLSDEAYNILKRLKANKSFSEIVIEITKEKSGDDIMKYAGTLSDEEGERMIKEVYSDRKKLKSRRFK